MSWKTTEYPAVGLHAPISLKAAKAVFLQGRVVTGSDGRIWALENVDDICGPEPFWISRSSPLTHGQAEAVGQAGAMLRTSFGPAGWFLFRYHDGRWYGKRMDPSVKAWEESPGGGPVAYGPRRSWFVAYPHPEIVGKPFEVAFFLEDLEI